MSNFDEAKSCLKKVVRLLQENSQLAETEADQRKLNTGVCDTGRCSSLFLGISKNPKKLVVEQYITW